MNIFQNRLNEVENCKNENLFKHSMKKITRKGYQIIKTEPFRFAGFVFNGNFHSNKIKEEKFTNFIRSYENGYYPILKELFRKLYEDQYSFFSEFQLEESNYSEISSNAKRLRRIIQKVNHIEEIPKINELIPVQRLKDEDKRYKGIRLFVNIRKDGYIVLYLIDLYHLGIDAYHVATGNYDLDRNYKSNEDCQKCISKIAIDYYREKTRQVV